MSNDRIVVGIDVGTTKVCALIAEVSEDDHLEVIGVGIVPSRGLKKAVVVNPEEVSVLAPRAGERTLTLVTCYPFYFVGHAPKRFVVRARQVFSTPAEVEARPDRSGTKPVMSQRPAGSLENGILLPG